MTEGIVHKEYVNQLASYIKALLSSCPACVTDAAVGRPTDHDCATVIRLNPKPNEVVDSLRRIKVAYPCYKGHTEHRHPWELPSTAHSVKQDRAVPNGPTRARPDIAVYDDTESPICFIEVQVKHPNPNVRDLAKAMEVPLFFIEPVEVKTIEPLASQTYLHNPAKGGFSHYMPDNDGARWADEMNYRMSEGMTTQQGGSSAAMYGLEDGTEIIEFTHGRLDSDPVGFLGGLLIASKAFNVGPCPKIRVE